MEHNIILKRIIILLSLGIIIASPVNAQVLFEWDSVFNGSADGQDWPKDMVVDSEGNVYVTGKTRGDSSDNYGTVKYDCEGNELWVAIYDPVGLEDNAKAVAVDDSGYVYVTGSSAGYPSSNFSQAIATIKYDSEGNQIWAVRYDAPGESHDCGTDITVDSLGNIYVTGWIDAEDISIEEDYVTIKYNSLGEQLWATTYDGTGSSEDIPVAIAVDHEGNSYVTGYSDNFTTSGWPRYDFATIKYDSGGVQQWAMRYGNTSAMHHSYPRAIALDDSGGIYVAGTSNDLGAYLLDYEFVVIKYSSLGDLEWDFRYDDSGADDNGANDVVVGPDGLIYAAGYTYYYGTGYDFAVFKFTPEGDVLFGPATCSDIYLNQAFAIAVDEYGFIYVAGDYGGTYIKDYAVVKYSNQGDMVWSVIYDRTSYDIPVGMGLDADGNIYVSGKIEGGTTDDAEDYCTIKYSQSISLVTLAPLDTTTFPASGGELDYSIILENRGTTADILDAWLDLVLPGGTTIDTLLGPAQGIILNAQTVKIVDRTLSIPANAPPGIYALRACLGSYDSHQPIVYIDSYLEFEKLVGPDGCSGDGRFIDTGEFFAPGDLPAESESVPLNYSFDLETNPNPFNPTTTLSFHLPSASRVKLNVYDITGRLVVELLDGFRSAGRHEMTFDASNLPSGVYIAHIIAGEVTMSCKLILLK